MWHTPCVSTKCMFCNSVIVLAALLKKTGLPLVLVYVHELLLIVTARNI